MKALDIYLAFCFCMVFGALLEYATVSYSGKRIKMNQKRLEEFQRNVEEMRADLARKLKVEQQLVRIEEDSRARHHLDGCPAKVTLFSIFTHLNVLDFSSTVNQYFLINFSISTPAFTSRRTSAPSMPATLSATRGSPSLSSSSLSTWCTGLS